MNQATWKAERINRAVVLVDVSFKSDETFTLNLQSDQHWDNPKCLRKVLRSHLERCKKNGTPIFINGDWFCAMQGKGDTRACKGDIRPEHNKKDYLKALVRTAADWLEPYAHLIVAIGEGNHETAVTKHKEYQLIPELVGMLNGATGSNIHAMGYGYWVKLQLR